MAGKAKAGSNQPPAPIIIVKKIVADGHGGHHGGAWKVAYADFVTAMMAFFLLLWILGATTEKQRKSIADYFAPTMITKRQGGAGGNGLFGGESIIDRDNYPHKAAQTGTKSLTIPAGAEGGKDVGSGQKGSLKEKTANEDRENFAKAKAAIASAMSKGGPLASIASHIRFIPTSEGMRIDLVDDADYSMFALGTTMLDAKASELIGLIATSIAGTDNQIMIRGHTDSVPYGDPRAMNNWMLSSGRAEATRRRLALGGIPERRFARIEGVADREPMIEQDPTDPRNRRVAITLLYRNSMIRR